MALPYLHSNAQLTRADGTRIAVEQLRGGDVVLGEGGRSVTIVENLKVVPPPRIFTRFGAGSLGRNEGLPDEDLYIDSSVLLSHKSRLVDAENLLNGNSISRTEIEKPANAFVLITADAALVRVNAILLATLAVEHCGALPLSTTVCVWRSNPRGEMAWRPRTLAEVMPFRTYQ